MSSRDIILFLSASVRSNFYACGQKQDYVPTSSDHLPLNLENTKVVIVESAVHKNIVQTARRMLKDGMDAKQISRYTGLSVEDIDTL